MKKLVTRIALLLLIWYLPQPVWAAETLVPGGQVVGLELGENRVCVAAFDDVLGRDAQEAGLRAGDEILRIDGRTVHTAQQVQEALNRSNGVVDMEVLRGEKVIALRLTPKITAEGPKLGVYLRQGVTGVGTVTWYDPESGTFGALGHGVNRNDGTLVQMTQGNAYNAKIQSVRKGKAGQPGQLMGTVTDSTPIGTLQKNTQQGVFGTVSSPSGSAPLPVAEEGEVHTGPATIRSTVDENGPREYSVEILKIYPGSRSDGRNLLIRVTDPALLAATGGIVQGMSGSPIIQDGKLVGAVTHVLVNQPDTGYGIFIDNMLEAAG